MSLFASLDWSDNLAIFTVGNETWEREFEVHEDGEGA